MPQYDPVKDLYIDDDGNLVYRLREGRKEDPR